MPIKRGYRTKNLRKKTRTRGLKRRASKVRTIESQVSAASGGRIRRPRKKTPAMIRRRRKK